MAILRCVRAQPNHAGRAVHIGPLEGVDLAPAPARPEREAGHVPENLGPQRGDDLLEVRLLEIALPHVVLREPADWQDREPELR
jgi:hypothetical protein